MDLEAIEEIKQLKARYFRYLDTKQWDLWATVFTADVVLEHPANRTEPIIGRENLIDLVRQQNGDVYTVHHGHTPEIEILDETHARGIWAMSDVLTYPTSLAGGPVSYHGSGHYIEQYLRVDGLWKIAHMHLRRLQLESSRRYRDQDLEMFYDLNGGVR